jgi:2,4-dienoyl-CoA reductase (NADPH2)
MVMGYEDAIRGRRPIGRAVAIIGAGGIGFDVAEFITHSGSSTSLDRDAFLTEWGIDRSYDAPGGLAPSGPSPHRPKRTVYLLQRKTSKMGKDLGKTTGWIHRALLKKSEVTMITGVEYRRIDDEGLHISAAGENRTLAVDHVILCAGQISLRDLQDDLNRAGETVHLIGGAERALELDAKRAIDQGARLAASL